MPELLERETTRWRACSSRRLRDTWARGGSESVGTRRVLGRLGRRQRSGTVSTPTRTTNSRKHPSALILPGTEEAHTNPSAGEGSASEPSLARGVSMCKDAKLSRRGNKVAARQMLANLVREAERGKAGLTDPRAEQKHAPIESQVKDYEGHLRNKGVSDKHLAETLRRLRAVLVGCKTGTLADLRVKPVVRFLVNLGDEGTGDLGRGILTGHRPRRSASGASGPNAWARMSWQASNRPQGRSDASAGR